MVKISINRMDLETKRLERPQIKNYTKTISVVSAASVTTLDISLGNVFDLSQAVSIATLNIINAPLSGSLCEILIIRTHNATTTSYSINWPSSFRWPGGNPPNLTQKANAVDIISAYTKNGGITWYASVVGLNMS